MTPATTSPSQPGWDLGRFRLLTEMTAPDTVILGRHRGDPELRHVTHVEMRGESVVIHLAGSPLEAPGAVESLRAEIAELLSVVVALSGMLIREREGKS